MLLFSITKSKRGRAWTMWQGIRSPSKKLATGTRIPLGPQVVLCLVLGLGGVLTSSRVLAQELNHQSIVLGERPLGMGGASTGVAGEISSIYYNPGGLASVDRAGLSGTLSFRPYSAYRLRNGLERQGRSTDLKGNADPGIPAFAAYALKVGKRDDSGRKRHTLAAGILSPQLSRRDIFGQLRDAQGQLTDQFEIEQRSRITWYSVAYAYRLSEALGIGASLVFATQTFSHVERGIQLDLGESIGNGVFENTNQATIDSRASFRSNHIVLRLGTTYRLNPKWQIGVMVQPPGIPAGGRAKIRMTEVTSVGANSGPQTSLIFEDQEGGLKSRTPLPFELRVGASYEPTRKVLLAMDVSLHGPTRSYRPFGQPQTDPETGRTLRPGLYVAEEWRNRAIANAALGMETIVRERFPVKLGFFTDFSAAPRISSPTVNYQPATLHNVGLTTSFGYISEKYQVEVGGIFNLGTGRALRLDPGATFAAPSYSATRAMSRQVFIFLTGASSTANALAKVAAKKVQEKVESMNQEDEDTSED